MTDLVLSLKACYFNDIKDGTKPEEFRLVTPYWRRRLEGRAYDRIVLTLGYPKRDDHERRLIRPWRGYRVTNITHPHFGPEPVQVFAIDVQEQPEGDSHPGHPLYLPTSLESTPWTDK